MRLSAALGVLALAACSAVVAPTENTTLVGAYAGLSINGSSFPVTTTPLPDGSKQEVLAEYLWISGSAGKNGVVWERVYRTTKGTAIHVDTVTTAGTFEATLNTATTTFGPVVASGQKLTLTALDGSVHVYQHAASQ